MKKLFAFISVFLMLSAAMFADVSAKKNADGTIAVTFFYGNPRASEVLLAGDFTNWQDGALPMEKGEKGFSLTVNFKAGEEGRYKFISDGNWTTDLRAPDFVDDGFGGKNSHIVIDDLVGGADDGGAKKAKINFISWTMIGVQGNYLTSREKTVPSEFSTNAGSAAITMKDSTRTTKVGSATITESLGQKKGLDLDSVTVGMKSYNKFVGSFLPNCPVYVEIALAETEMEDYSGDKTEKLNYIYRQDRYGNNLVDPEEGLKQLISGLVANPVAYMSKTTNNQNTPNFGSIPGPGANPFLGHLKFGFNTPYINFITGFNYAKPSVRDAITWKTVTGNWDAGYQHVGGFNQFSLGDKAAAFLEEKTGMKFDIGFAPNKTGDRKGTKYGYWGWAGVAKDDLAIDFQTNGMYNGDYIFYEPVEHDFILGAKDTFAVGDGKVSVAVQGLLATHQKSSEEIAEFNAADGNGGNTTDYFGYSTDVYYRNKNIDGIQNFAGNATVGYKAEKFEVTGEYRFRGAQASMLYVRENHDDATFDLSDQLGVCNEQRAAVNATVTPIEGLSIGVDVKAKMALQKLHTTKRQLKDSVIESIKAGTFSTSSITSVSDLYDLVEDSDVAYAYSYNAAEGRQSWYDARFDDNRALYDIDGGAYWTFEPSVSYELSDLGLTVGAYTQMNYSAYDFAEDVGNYLKSSNDFSSTESPFRLSTVGVTASKKFDSDILKGVDVYYGFDNTNGARLFNTLVGQVKFAKNFTVTLAAGLKTVNDNDAAREAGYKDYITFSDDYSSVTINKGNSDLNNPFAFAVGVAKQFDKLKKPTVYAQFVYNTDPFKHFGDGQDQLNLEGANVKGSVEKDGAGNIDPVDWYEGRAAVRVGVRWDI